ncbi:MAG TPA: zinc-binding dehydrogenase [Candidatus Dormibacteraeota bacterium]
MSKVQVPSGVRSEGRAAVLREAQGPSSVKVEDWPRGELAEGQVAVGIRFAGLNHLDLWLVSGAQRFEPPRVLCADGAGVVEESRDPRWKPGDEVVIYPVGCDWTCDACQAGQQVLCPRMAILGEQTDGTACERLVISGNNLYRRPAGLSWAESAAFPLTFLTAWRMLSTRARLQPGETLLVVGAGAGVASAAIILGRHLGARVLATSRSEEKRKRAEALGAELTFPSEGFNKAVREATGGRGVDVVFEHVGPATLEESIRSVRKAGRVVFCGSTTGVRAEVHMPRLFLNQVELIGSTMGNASEFEGVLGVINAGLKPIVDSAFPLERVSEALEHLDRGEQFGKVLVEVKR